jgi:hypothetical protein
MEAGCSWCSVLYETIFESYLESLAPSPLHEPGSPADFGKIFLMLKSNITSTPPGRNMYYYSYK